MRLIKDFCIACWLVWAVVRKRGRTVQELRRRLADTEYELRTEKARIEVLVNELGVVKSTNRTLQADLEVAQREIEGVARAHDVLCRLLEAQAAFHVRRTEGSRK